MEAQPQRNESGHPDAIELRKLGFEAGTAALTVEELIWVESNQLEISELEMVDQIFTSSKPVTTWLRELSELQHAAKQDRLGCDRWVSAPMAPTAIVLVATRHSTDRWRRS